MKLHLSEDLTLPVDVVTQTLLVVGKRGSGKSTTAARLVEQIAKAGVPFVVLDPADTWWGLKASRAGGVGLPVYVLGGRHADLPLEPGGGALVAELLCEHRIPLVLSCKHLSGGARSRFMIDFASTLFQKWGGGPLHVVLEEAHELAPQSIPKGEQAEAMLGAFKRLWKLGRSSGIGGTAITQRPASLSKDITTQSEILVVHKTIGPQDVDAVKAWIRYHQESEEILGQLATLKTGEAFLWAPEFPEDAPIGLKRVQISPRETFDSSATPKVGEKRVEPKELAPVDLERLRSKMASTIERAKAEDPRELRKTIADLRAELKRAAQPKPTETPKRQPGREVPVLTDAQVKRLEVAAARLEAAFERHANRTGLAQAELSKALDAGQAAAQQIRVALAQATRAAASAGVASAHRASHVVGVGRPAMASRPAPAVPPRAAPPPADGLTGPEQRILDAIAWLESLGQRQPEEAAVAFLSGYTVGGGAFNNPRGALRTKGLVTYPAGGRLALTEAGRAQARTPEDALTPDELQARVLQRLPGPEQKLLRVLLDKYPEPVTNEELARAAGYEPGGGAFNNPRGRLRSLGLVDYPDRGLVRALPVLFLEVS